MKVELNPILEKLSGRIKDLVFVVKNKTLLSKGTIKDPVVYIRSAPKKSAPPSIKQDHLNQAFKILIAKFKELKQDAEAYKTWQIEAKRIRDTENRSLTAYNLFTSFYMTAYTHTIGIDVTPNNLSDGISLNWQDRFSRSWSG